MENATGTLSQGSQYRRAEARRMFEELYQLLIRRGTWSAAELERRLHGTRYQVDRRTIQRWIAGTSTPRSVDQVEAVAIAAGVSLAYLLPDEPIPYALEDLDDDRLDEEATSAPAPRRKPGRRPTAANRSPKDGMTVRRAEGPDGVDRDRTYSTTEAASFLGCVPGDFRDLYHGGELAGTFDGRGHIRLRGSDLLAWADRPVPFSLTDRGRAALEAAR